MFYIPSIHMHSPPQKKEGRKEGDGEGGKEGGRIEEGRKEEYIESSLSVPRNLREAELLAFKVT